MLLREARDLQLFNDLNVVASVQPVFLQTDWAPADSRWGPQGCRYAYAWKSLIQAGLRLQFGSDAPVETMSERLPEIILKRRKGDFGSS